MHGEAFLVVLDCSEHVSEGVNIILQPKIIALLNVELWLGRINERSGFTCVDYDVIVMHSSGRAQSDRSCSDFELPKKPLVPVVESIVRLCGVTNIERIVNFHLCLRAEPTVW